MNSIKTILFIIFFLPFALSAENIDNIEAFNLVKQISDKTFGEIKNRKDEINENPNILKEIVTKHIKPNLYERRASFYVLSKYFKDYDKEKLLEFTDVFSEHMVHQFAILFSFYENQEIIIIPSNKSKTQKLITITALVKEDSKPDIKLGFKMGKNRNDNKWYLYDVIAEGISMLNSKRSEYQNTLRNEGIDPLIEHLKKINKRDIVIEK